MSNPKQQIVKQKHDYIVNCIKLKQSSIICVKHIFTMSGHMLLQYT